MSEETMKTLVIRARELPIPIVLEGDNGEREVYQLTRAGRKFGACLQKVFGPLRELVLRLISRR